MSEFDADLTTLRSRSQPDPTAPLGAPQPLDGAELNIEDDLAQLRGAKSVSPVSEDPMAAPDTVVSRPLTKNELAVDELDQSLRYAASSDPADEAQRRNLATRLGVEKEMLPEGDEAKQEIFLKENDPEALLRSNPEIATYLADLDNAAIAGQDVSNLKKVSNLMRRLSLDPLVATAKTVVAVPQTLAGLYKIYDRAVMSMIPESLTKAVDAATPQAAREALGDVQASLGGLVDFEQTQQVIEELYSPETLAAKGRVQQAKGFFPTLGTAIENPSVIATTVVESIGPMLLGGAAAQTIVKAFPALSPLVAGAIGEGTIIAGGTAQAIAEETGEDLTGQQALLSVGAGALGAGIGVLGGRIMQKLGLADIDTALAKGTLEASLKEAKVPKSLVTRILAGAAGEGALEELPQSAIEQVAQNIGTGKTWDEGIEEAMAMGFLAGATMGGVVQVFTPTAPQEGLNKEIDDATVAALRNIGQAQQAEDAHQTLNEFSRDAAASNLRKNSPEEFKKFIRTMADEGGMIEEVFVDAAKLDEAFAQSDITPEELQEKMPDVVAAMNLAKQTGSEVRISFDDYATYIAGSKAETPIIEHLRTTAEGMTYAESQQFFQGQEQELTAQAKKILDENQPVLSRQEFELQGEGDYQTYLQEHENKREAFAVDAKQVHDNILDGLVRTGRFTKDVNAVYAVPFREFFATAAAKEGILPSEVFERMPLNFQNVRVEGEGLTQPGANTAKPEDFSRENVKDILAKTDWMILTAHNPNDTVQDDATNATANAALRKDLKDSGMVFEAVMGRHGADAKENESFLVYGASREKAAEMARKYNQESVLTREGFVYQSGLVAPANEVKVYADVDTALKGATGYTRVPSTGAVFATNAPGDSLTVRGVHFSKEQREVLQAKFVGTGMPAAERARLLDSDDPRISKRVDFYTDTGNGITPEAGLGAVRHEILLKNVYDGANNPRKFKAIPGRMPFQKMNDFETQVLDAGFDGYFVEQGGQGRVVMLGAAAENIPAGRDDIALKYGITGNGQPGKPSISAAPRGPITSTRESDGSLQGLPRKVGGFQASHFAKAEEVAVAYMEQAGMEYDPPNTYAKVDKARAKRIADAFEAMEHNPQDPLTKAAYAAMIQETVAQYKTIIEQTGLKVEFVTGEDPYGSNPRAMTDDVRDNNHMWLFSTRDGFGTDQTFDPKDNPLLGETDVEISGQKALANDLFRMVHDYFGHVKEGVGFRANGEENTWRAHASMFTPLARRALTTETRGQNSWLNFGPFGETNRTAKVEDTHFADQKIGLLPEWASEEGRGDAIDALAQTVQIRKGNETLKKYGLKPGSAYSTREVAAALEARQRAKYGSIAKDDRSKDALKRISSWMADEVAFEMSNPEGSGVGWYSEKFQSALDILGEKYPELKDEQNARDTMTALIAITSDGEKVSVNTMLADRMYAEYRKSGKFDAAGITRATSIKGNLKVLQELYDSMGVDKAHEYLMSEMTVSDLKKAAAKRGNQVTTPYQAHIKLPMAALELGPKLGAFYANLMGSHGYLTMDRWWSRSFNRYRGALLDAPTQGSMDSFRKLIGNETLSNDEVLAATVKPTETYEARGFKTRLALMVGRSQMGTSKQKADWLAEAKEKAGIKFEELFHEHNVERAANTVYKAAFIKTMDTPFNASDRTFMLDATAEARRKLSRRGHKMSIADIQAVLWYYEKKLYGELGAKQTAKTSYEDAATGLIAGRLSEEGISDPDRQRPGTVEGLQERVSPGESDYLQSVQPEGSLFQTLGLTKKTVTSNPPRDGFEELTKIRDRQGAPLTVFRGSNAAIQEEHFRKEALGFNSGAAPSGRGVHFTTRKSSAAVHGDVREFELDIRNPFVFKADDPKIPTHDTAGEYFDWRESLREQGYDGMVEIASHLGGPNNIIAFDPDQVILKPTELMQEKEQIRAAYDPTTFTVSLLKGADLSSVIHEGGHFYLEALADMAGQPNATQRVKDDFQKTLKWFGINGENPEQTWRIMTLDQKRQFHEQWAQSFERYALEGKAPTLEMQPVFSRFRAWMLSVYKSLKQFLEQNPLAGKLNDDLRQVFDRLLAAEESIRETEKAREYAPLFASAEEAGVTEKEFQSYMEAGEDATALAVDELGSRSLRDMQWLSNAKDKALKALQREASTQRKVIRDEVADRVDAEPINQARRLLRKGELLNEDGTVRKLKEHKLDTAMVKSLRPDMKLSRISGMTKPGGISPDLAAQFFGFGSGDALIEELLTAPSAKDKTDALTDKRMLEEHGDLVDPEAIKRAAEKAIHNEARARFMATGLKMLMKTPAGANQMAKAAKQAAENAIEQKKVRELSPAQYARAEQRANREALKNASKDVKKAIEAQRAALLNNRLSRAASDAKLEVESALRYLKKFDSPGVRKKLDIDYLEQIDDLKGAFDLRKGVTRKALDKRKSLADWIDEQEANGFEPAIDPAVMDELKRKHYKDMTLTEIRGLVDSIKQIEHLGRMKKRLLTLKEKREFAAVVDDAYASIEVNANRTVKERATPTDVVGVTAKWLRMMAAAHRKFNSIIREMDGGRDNGTMWNLLSRGMNEAGDIETEMKQTAATQIAELFSKLPKQGIIAGNIYSKKKLVPNTDLSMTYEQRIMFALNWGNEGNRQRLLDGGISGTRAISSPDAKKVLDTLNKEDWDFVQGIWDYIGGYKEQVAALERRITGVEPEWVESAPVETRFGTYRGGYFPAKYDTELSTRSETLEAATDLRMGMKGAFQSAAARNGYTKARADQVINRPLLLSYNVISQHVSEVTHRLAWQPWLIDANRLLKALDAPIRKHYGPEILRELKDTVVDIAQGDAPAKNATEAAINRLRVGSTIVGMGWRFSTALLQPTGISQSWSRIGGKWVARGIGQYMKNPNAAARFVDANSRLMKDRGITMQREINEVLNRIRAGEKVSALTASYFTMIAKMQRTVDIPTWLGAYEKNLQLLKYENATAPSERKSIEEHAVALSDQAVIDSQSGGQLKDLAKVQRGSPIFKIFTNFYSYFSAAYNLNIEAVRRTDFKSPSQVGLLAVDLILINVVPVIMAVALKLALKGGCEPDDLECLADKYAEEQVSHLMGQMILLREAGAAVGVATGGAGYGYQGPAGLRFFGDLYKVGTQVSQGEADMALFKAVNSVGGAVLHYPAGQINATLEGIMAVERGDVEGVSILPALISGPPRK